MERLLTEFMEFCKTREAQGVRAQNAAPRPDGLHPGIGKGWPQYKGYAASLQNPSAFDTRGTAAPARPSEAADTELRHTPIPQVAEQAEAASTEPPPIPYAPVPMPPPAQPPESGWRTEQDRPAWSDSTEHERHAKKEYEVDFAHHIMGDISAVILPHVMLVINEQEFAGSPVFEGNLYRERMHQMIDSILTRAAAENHDVAEILRSADDGSSWQRRHLLRALAESLLIGELFFRRRPIYRKLIDNGWDPYATV